MHTGNHAAQRAAVVAVHKLLGGVLLQLPGDEAVLKCGLLALLVLLLLLLA
jgi:hypothetical protein